MKKSNKLATAGVGLLIAAVAGIGPALASDGTAAELEGGSNVLDVSAVSDSNQELETADSEEASDAEGSEEANPGEEAASTDEERNVESDVLDVEGIDNTKTEDTAHPESQEVAEATEDSSAEKANEDAAEQVAPVKADKVGSVSSSKNNEEGTAETNKDEAEESAAPLGVKVKPIEDVAQEVAPKETEPVVTEPEAKQTIAPVEVSPEAEPVPAAKSETKATQPAAPQRSVKKKTSVNAAASQEKPNVVPVKIVKVDYVMAKSSLSTTRSINTVGKVNAAPAKPQELGPVLPLLEAVSETPTTQGTVNLQPEPTGVKTENGQSMVVWFELPPAEGPALQPGQSTAPLLGSAVTETAVSSNVIPAAQVAPQQAPAGVTATASAAVPVANSTVAEHGVMARTLARTGSLAQYAAMLSAVAMIIGVGMLIGAAAARRRQD